MVSTLGTGSHSKAGNGAVSSTAGARQRQRSKVAPPAVVEDEYLETDSEVDEFAVAGPSGSSDVESADGDEEEEEEGVGQWVPDDWEGDEAEGSGSGSDSDEEQDSADEQQLQDDIRQIPLATLMKAQKSLRKAKKAQAALPPPTDKDKLALAKARLAEMQQMKGKGKAVQLEQEESAKDSDDSEEGGRRNKHAPAVMSTKRQVSRHRQAIALPKKEVRDPRFSSISGDLNPHLHSQAYSFLPDLLKNEFHDLRRAVAAAQKAERTCPLREKEARVEERERLERDLGRLRTKMDRSKAETREREVLAQVKKEEREKRSEGKGAWFMKKGEKKDLLLKARFEALEKAGGKRAVKKAVDKKRKKVAGKEKKSRPDGVGGQDSKRRRIA